MMKGLGKLYGLDVYTDINCGTTKIKFTRKQTRKFTNTRWVKKYLKKYSYKDFTPGMMQYKDKIIIHPEVYRNIIKQQELDLQSAPLGYSTMGVGNYG